MDIKSVDTRAYLYHIVNYQKTLETILVARINSSCCFLNVAVLKSGSSAILSIYQFLQSSRKKYTFLTSLILRCKKSVALSPKWQHLETLAFIHSVAPHILHWSKLFWAKDRDAPIYSLAGEFCILANGSILFPSYNRECSVVPLKIQSKQRSTIHCAASGKDLFVWMCACIYITLLIAMASVRLGILETQACCLKMK